MTPTHWLFSLVLLWILAAPASAARRVAVILDTSGSMTESDPARNTVRLSQVISDLVDDTDSLAIIEMPAFNPCDAGPDSDLMRTLDASQRMTFKSDLERGIRYWVGTNFAAPVRTAIRFLGNDESQPRLLLIIADAGGFGECDTALTADLQRLRNAGARTAVINIGTESGSFFRNPAFDLTSAARTPEQLVSAVGTIYQRFIGVKSLQTGRVTTDINLVVGPYVSRAFLVIVADEPVATVELDSKNPGSTSIDRNFRGGGETTGLDGLRRSYRIVSLTQPQKGNWRFVVPGLKAPGGWMLVQESGVALRLTSPPKAGAGADSLLTAELYDKSTGARIADPRDVQGLDLSMNVDGQGVTFRDDGQGGDAVANDGILSAVATFTRLGHTTVPYRVQSDLLDQKGTFEIEVIEQLWDMTILTPPTAEVESPVLVSAKLQPMVSVARPNRAPVFLRADGRGVWLELRDDGRNGDAQGGDGIYSGSWTPEQVGSYAITYSADRGTGVVSAASTLEVVGSIRFGPPKPIAFAPTASGTESRAILDLSEAKIKGQFDVKVRSDLWLSGASLQLRAAEHWVALGTDDVTLTLTGDGPRAWPLRLEVASCPQSCDGAAPHWITISGTRADGSSVTTEIPLSVTVLPDPWLRCWWRTIVQIALVLATAFVLYGFWAPSRFPKTLGVVLSAEEDMDEGYYFAIRNQPGSGSGFYRDARVFIGSDFRVSGRAAGAVARLRAHGKQVRVRPEHGNAVWRETADGNWEPLPVGEVVARPGTRYRDDRATLFFQLRHG